MIYDFDTPPDRRATHSIKWTKYPPDVLPLWVADMDFVSPEPVARALRRRLDHEIFGYQSDFPPLRDVIVERMAARHNFPIQAADIVFIPGLVAALNLICRTFADVGSGVLVTPPIYPPFLSAPTNGGRTLVTVQMRETVQGNRLHYTFDFDALEAAITQETKLFLLCNPHNPVGRVYTRDELAQLADFVIRHDLLLISDEIHSDLVFKPYKHLSIAAEFPELRDRTITLLAPSKTFNIAGLSCGFAVITNEELRNTLSTVAFSNGVFVNSIGYTAADAAYRDGQEWLDQLLPYLRGNRDFLLEYVEKNLPQARMTLNEGTFLAWIDFSAYALPDTPFEFFLRHAKVALNDGAMFGAGWEKYTRLNFGCPRSTLQEALDKICEAIRTQL